MLFPAVRARGDEVERFLAAAAAEHPTPDDVPAEVLQEGLALLGDDERERIVELWTLPYEDRWQSLTAAAANIPAAERALVMGALRAGIAERQPTPAEVVELLEGGRLRRSPLAALALVIPPPYVWSVDEASGACAAMQGRRRSRKRMDVVESVAYALMSFEHVRRVRSLCARVAGELPFAGLPRSSLLLRGACADVRREAPAARAAAAALLIAYAEQRVTSLRRTDVT